MKHQSSSYKCCGLIESKYFVLIYGLLMIGMGGFAYSKEFFTWWCVWSFIYGFFLLFTSLSPNGCVKTMSILISVIDVIITLVFILMILVFGGMIVSYINTVTTVVKAASDGKVDGTSITNPYYIILWSFISRFIFDIVAAVESAKCMK